MELLREKSFTIPLNAGGNKVTRVEVEQDEFYGQYFPSSHRIFCPIHYPDINIYDEDDRFVETHKVNRTSVPWQKMSVQIILAHLLGNKTYLSDSTLKDNPSLPAYREYWDERNIDIARYKVLKNILSLADGALIFYLKNGKLEYQSLSMFDDDEYYMEYDRYRKPHKFYHYYDEYCDVYNDVDVKTYKVTEEGKGEWVRTIDHGFNVMPVAYHKRQYGAFWTPVQRNIDNAELMLSRISEDNRAKFRSVYHLSTDNPEDVQTDKAGMMDMVVTGEGGNFKLVPPAEISEQFEFEYKTEKENIFDALGIVFPKHKSSGDMPTGSMKMMFYPTERVVMDLINEFDELIDTINDIVQRGFVIENPDHMKNIVNGSVKATIRLFTPQDESERNENIATMYDKGVISKATASEEVSFASNNEIERIKKESEEEIDEEKRRADNRVPFGIG